MTNDEMLEVLKRHIRVTDSGIVQFVNNGYNEDMEKIRKWLGWEMPKTCYNCGNFTCNKIVENKYCEDYMSPIERLKK